MVAGAIVVLGGGLAVLYFWGQTPKTAREDDSRKNRTIRDVGTNVVAKAAVTNEHPGMVLVRGKWYPEYNEKGGHIWVTHDRVRYHTPVVVTNSANAAGIRPERKIFKNPADQEIAILLNTPVGTRLIGDIRYGKFFVKKFLESLESPIIVSHDDPEDVQKLKRAVNETKIELKARYDAGEDIAKIMADSRKELQHLGAYREELRREVEKCMRTGDAHGNSKAIEELYSAANKMLTDRGLPELKLPTALLNNLRLHNK